MPLIKLYANLRSTAGKKEVRLPGFSLQEVIQGLIQAHPELEKFLLENGSVRPRVILSLNGQTLSLEDLQIIALKDEDVLAIFPPVAGG